MQPGRRLGIDWGQARIGVAASDPDGRLAVPVTVVPAGPDEIDRLLALVAEYEAVEVVVGLPRSLDGSDGPAANLVREKADQLVAGLATAGSPAAVRLIDERFTTITAEQRLRAGGKSAKQQRRVIDAESAREILNHALETERHTDSGPGQLRSPQ
jgi:putative Holliday junction resolvase